MTGQPGKCPAKNGSPAVTPFRATQARPVLEATTRSISRMRIALRQQAGDRVEVDALAVVRRVAPRFVVTHGRGAERSALSASRRTP